MLTYASVTQPACTLGLSGISFFVSPLYIVETSEASVRGALCSVNVLMLNLGVAAVSMLNIHSLVEWNYISMVFAFVPVAIAVALAFVPESPYHLMNKGEEEQATKALKERYIQKKREPVFR